MKVYLPRKDSVILELLFDRIGNNTRWRTNLSVWQLFQSTWTLVDSETRERLFINNDFIHILEETFSDIRKKLDFQLVSEISNVVALISETNIWVKPAADNGVNFLTSFLMVCADFSSYDITTVASRFNPIVRVCINSGLKTKKLKSKAFISAFYLSVVIREKLPPKELSDTINTIFTLFVSEIEASEFQQPFEDGLKLAGDASDVESTVAMIFKIICETPNQRSKASVYFKIFVNKIPTVAFDLLQIAVAKNVKFPENELSEMVKENILVKDSPNWDLLKEINSLDNDVIFKLSDDIFAILDENDEGCVEFSRSVIKSYSQAREFPDFFLRWSYNLLPENPIWWNSQKIIDEISHGLKQISSEQFDKLFKALITPEQTDNEPARKKRKKDDNKKQMAFLPLITMVKSLLSFTGTNRLVSANWENLETLLKLDIELDNPLLWELKYLVLSINKDYVQLYSSSTHCIDQLPKRTKKISSDLWFQLAQVVFRIMEISESEITRIDELLKDYLKFLKKSQSDVDVITKHLKRMTYRWPVLIDTKFSAPDLELISEIYTQNAPSLMELTSNSLFYDSPNFFRQILATMIDEMKSINELGYVRTVENFPPELFTKQLRTSEEKLVNILCNLEVKSYEKSPDNETTEKILVIRKALANLLRRPSGLSQLETDFKELEELLERRFSYKSQEMDQLSNEISESVLRYHAVNLKSGNKVGEKFIKSAVERLKKLQEEKITLRKSTKSSKVFKYTWVLKLSCVLLMELLELVDYESSGFIMSTVSACEHFLDRATSALGESDEDSEGIAVEIQLLLKQLRDVSGKFKLDSFERVYEKAFKLFEKSIERSQLGLATESFLLLCETADPKSSKPLLITSKFIFLFDFVDLETLVTPYCHFLKKLNSNERLENFYNLLDCFKKPPIDCGYIEAISALYSVDVNEDLSTLGHETFTRTISLGLEYCSNFDEKSILAFLQLVKIVLREKSWLVSQYALESIITLVCKISSNQGGPRFVRVKADEIYVEMTMVLSSVLLFHRHRINGRHHLVMRVFKSLLKCLTNVTPSSSAPWITHPLGPNSAEAYSRLLSNLNEPPAQSIRERSGKNNLTSSSAQAKKQLSKYVHVLLLSYCRYSLNPRFPKEVNDALRPGFYTVFNVLGPEGQRFVSSLMDQSTRDIFRSLYDDYVKNGKWKAE